MKFNILSLSLALGIVFTLLTSSMRNPNNPPTGKTGAPGEVTCGQSGCHSGGNYTGTVKITGVPDTIVAGHVYPITLTNTSNAVRSGFELTCLDNNNTKCGTLATASGVSVATASSRQYARQSTPKNLSAGSVSWTFNWTAPATANGNKATFYFVSLCANGNGGTSGDKALVGTKAIVFPVTSPTTEPYAAVNVKLFPTVVTEVLHVELINEPQGRIFIYTLDGRLVKEAALADTNTLDVAELHPGTYLAKIQTEAGYTVKKFIKN